MNKNDVKNLSVGVAGLSLIFIVFSLFPDKNFTFTFFSFLMFLISSIIYLVLNNSQKETILSQSIPEEFENIYERLCNNDTSSLDSIRITASRYNTLQYIVGPLLLIILFIFCIVKLLQTFWHSDNFIYVLIILLVALSFAPLILISLTRYITNKPNKHYKEYLHVYKEEIISNFINLTNNQLKYTYSDENDNTLLDSYQSADWTDFGEFGSIYSNDHIETYLNNTAPIHMYGLCIKNYFHDYRSGDDHLSKVFDGIFTYVPCPKNIDATIVIFKERGGLQINSIKDSNHIKTNNKEFEKYFRVYSNNETVAIQFFTNDVMNCLVDLHKQYNIEYEIVIKNGTVYMRFFTGQIFNPIFKNSIDKNTLFKCYCTLNFILDTNQKINKILQDFTTIF